MVTKTLDGCSKLRESGQTRPESLQANGFTLPSPAHVVVILVRGTVIPRVLLPGFDTQEFVRAHRGPNAWVLLETRLVVPTYNRFSLQFARRHLEHRTPRLWPHSTPKQTKTRAPVFVTLGYNPTFDITELSYPSSLPCRAVPFGYDARVVLR